MGGACPSGGGLAVKHERCVTLSLFLPFQLGKWSQFSPAQLVKIIKLLLSLLKNNSVYLEPYGRCVYPHLRTIVLDSAYLSFGGEFDHWHVRQLAAAAMAQLVHRSEKSFINRYY